MAQWNTDLSERLRWEFQNRRRQIVVAHQQGRRTAQFEREQVLSALEREAIGLSQLCPQDRATALQVLAARRRDVHQQFHFRINDLNRQRQEALLALDQWYDQARGQIAVDWRLEAPAGYTVGYGGGFGAGTGIGSYGPAGPWGQEPNPSCPSHQGYPTTRTFSFSFGQGVQPCSVPGQANRVPQPIIGWAPHNRL
ncbi:MAG TPA: hypothetical protein VIY86_10885 [Pirellulaceae bacterium]